MPDTHVVRCHNGSVHRSRSNPDIEQGVGNILCFLQDDSIYIKCSDHHCKRWTRLKITPPHSKIDFNSVAIEQSLMPQGYHFDARKAVTVIDDSH